MANVVAGLSVKINALFSDKAFLLFPPETILFEEPAYVTVYSSASFENYD